MPTTTVIVIKMEYVVLKRKTRETNKQICTMTNQIIISFSISQYETFSKFQGSEKLPHIF